MPYHLFIDHLAERQWEWRIIFDDHGRDREGIEETFPEAWAKVRAVIDRLIQTPGY